jgi:Fic family protein
LATLRLFELLPTMPRINIERAARVLEVSVPTATKAIQGLQAADVLEETTGRSRNQSFLYSRYVRLLMD